jgi:N-acetylglucosamine kinase-like BadF-type ATPase
MFPAQVPVFAGRRLLGIDPGGSGTRVVLLEGGQVTDLAPGPPMNALLTPGIAEQLEKIIRDASPDAVGIGLPGLRPDLTAGFSRALRERTGCPVVVTSDGETARSGAFLGGPGVVVIAGTGSGAVGWDGVRSARAGGRGFLLGDEGSAYWIGRQAASLALYREDGMGGSEALRQTVLSGTGVTSLEELIAKVNTNPAERTVLTVLAPVVTALAETDPEARRLVEEAADHLVTLVRAVRSRLSSSGPSSAGGPLPVAGIGGVFKSTLIWDRFAAATGAVRPLASPAVGAALLAAREVGL